MEFKEGYVLLFNWNESSLLGKAIKFYNEQKYGDKGWSHSAIISEVTKDQCLVHEAVNRGFVSSYYNKSFLNEVIKQGRCKVRESKIKLKDVKTNADKYVGKKYSWTTLIQILLIYLFKGKAGQADGTRGLICSEAVTRVLYDSSNKKINFETEFNIPFDFVDPMMINLSKQLRDLK